MKVNAMQVKRTVVASTKHAKVAFSSLTHEKACTEKTPQYQESHENEKLRRN